MLWCHILAINISFQHSEKYPISAMIISGAKSRKTWQLNRTRIHLILFSPLSIVGKGGRTPFRAKIRPSMDYIVAREGKGQRVVPTDMAAGDNEIGRRRDFSDTHFLGGGWLSADAVGNGLLHDWALAKAWWGRVIPVYVARLGRREFKITEC